jgi:hypothetical protein
MRNVGNPARQLVGGGVRGLLGLDPADYADTLGMEAYRNAQALSMAPTPLAFAALPAAVVKGAKAAKAAKEVAPRAEALETARQNAVKMLGLPENNTPMDRAKALGFVDEGLLHGTVNDFPAFEKSARHSVYATDKPEISDIYATATGRHKGLREVNAGPNVMPLMSRGKRIEVSDFRNGSGGWMRENLAEKIGAEMPSRAMWKELPKHGYQSAKVEMDDIGGRQVQYIFPDPTVLRSRFAAFDPARVNENDLLGRADPALLALIAAGTGGYALSNRQRKDEPLGQLSGLLAP